MKNFKPICCKFRAEDTVEVEVIQVDGMPVVQLETRDGGQKCDTNLTAKHAKRLRRRLKAAIAEAEAPAKSGPDGHVAVLDATVPDPHTCPECGKPALKQSLCRPCQRRVGWLDGRGLLG